MTRNRRVLTVLALLAALLACYCFAGIVMNASFFGASGAPGYSRAAIAWAVAFGLSLVAAVGLAIAAWRVRQP
jgi:hypothetical protein